MKLLNLVKNKFSLIILLSFNFVNSQESECYFVPEDWMLKQNNYSNRFQSIPDDGRKFVFNVKFHFALGTNGENLYSYNEEKFLKIIGRLNIAFNSHNIFFKYRGFNFIKDTRYTQLGFLLDPNNPYSGLTRQSMKQKFVNESLHDENAINFYIVNYTANAYSQQSIFLNPTALNDQSVLSTSSPVHEMGHYFGLFHTFEAAYANYSLPYITSNLPECIANADNVILRRLSRPISFNETPFSTSEHVTRDPLNPKYNADIAGDRVTDTGATFERFHENFCQYSSVAQNDLGHFNEDPRFTDNSGDANISCYYCFSTSTKYTYTVGSTFYTTSTNGVETTTELGSSSWQNIIDTVLTNCIAIGSGETYKNLDNEIHNYMSYGRIEPIVFTLGQVTRMRESIINNINDITGGNSLFNFTPSLNLNDDGSPDTSVLYEPFTPMSITNNSSTFGTAYSKTMTPNQTNTGVDVWNCGPFTMNFQTGFNCEFSFPNGSIIAQTPLQQYSAICNGYIGVKIPILGNEIIQNMEPLCFSSFEPYIKGEVKSLDYLGSIYITTQQLDAIKVSNPDLYNELQSGKYHIIIKETESGYKDQKIIYKN